MTASGIAGPIAWGAAWRALGDDSHCGDVHVVVASPEGALAGVADGLGHGEEAEDAAKRAADVLREHSAEPVDLLLQRCHVALKPTRGAAVSLASFRSADSVMTWIGVGNVEAALVHEDHSRESLLLRGGVVGQHVPKPRSSVAAMRDGDLVIFATDGVNPGFAEDLRTAFPPEGVAADILDRCGRGTDDALVLVLKWQAGGGYR
jgi:phosphoserine phosphatase RsbX